MNPPKAGTRVHFVGIGGIGMSALAELLMLQGCRVSGTDRTASPITERLARLGARVDIGHAAAAAAEADLLVFTPAVAPDNPELAEAARRGIPTVKRAALLGALSRGKRVVAVTGTHGKTTTTAMTGAVLEAGELDPTLLVGGVLRDGEQNLKVGAGDTWVLEADEFDRSFHELAPTVAAVTSLEADHLDSYGTLDAIVDAYETFLDGLSDGTAVLNAESPAVRSLALPPGAVCRTFGIEQGDLQATAVTGDGLNTRFVAVEDGEQAAEIGLRLPGRHNVMNALAASAAARSLGVAWDRIARGLAGFRGVHRRFEVLGEASGVVVVSDYAHHPTEIAATLTAARERHTGGRVVVLFQPHLYSRTRDFADAFGAALATGDRVFVTGVYAAREAPLEGVDEAMLAQKVAEAGQPDVTAVGDLTVAAEAAAEAAQPGDMVLVMGAGDVERAGPDILDRLRSRA